MATFLSNPTLTVNNLVISIVPNSFSYTPGKGEQTMKVQSAGGGSTQTVFSDNVETKLSTVKFQVYTTNDTAGDVDIWKTNKNLNTITATENDFTRSFTGAALLNDPEIKAGSEGTIDLEFTSNPAI